jgi:prepilin-type N-terminal cleavage/methylation domain-containing protein
MKKQSSHIRPDLRRAGFTLVEMLVVIGITTLLSAIAIGYSKIGQNEVALSVETSKIAELILQAKELAINTYGTTTSGARACAFGVHLDLNTQTYTLFAFSPNVASAGRCPSAASSTEISFTQNIAPAYQAGSENIPVAQGVQMNSGANDFTDVLFYPPAPETLINTGGFGGYFAPALTTSKIYLSTIDGHNTSVITVNAEGQVTF